MKKSWVWRDSACCAGLAARFIPGPRTIDDSYITFRYARNLLTGEGFVYNPGERVLGTTTPLYTLLMAGLAALAGGPGDFPALALGVNALADAATCLLLWQLGSAGSQRAGARRRRVGGGAFLRDLCDRRAGDQRLCAADRGPRIFTRKALRARLWRRRWRC